MRLKLDEQGHVVVEAGKPVYVHDDGREAAFDVADAVSTIGRLNGEIHAEKVGRHFTRSSFVADRLAIPGDIAESYFGRMFKLENGRPVAYDQHGNKIFSRQNPGAVAGFDEALEILIGQHPNREIILKAPGSARSPADAPSVPAGIKTMPRVHFDSMTPANRAAFVKAGGRLID